MAENDPEMTEKWLERLAALNVIIASTGEPLVGNLCYDHLQEDYAISPPNPILRTKRQRLRAALSDRSRLLEIGVNGGHSAYVALTSAPSLVVHGVDICEHAYARPAARWLEGEFPGRFFFHEGDSRLALRKLYRAGLAFDSFHLDGAKHLYYEDALNCALLARGSAATVIVDDTQQDGVRGIWDRCLREGLIVEDPYFPSMSTQEIYRHEIGSLQPITRTRRNVVLGCHLLNRYFQQIGPRAIRLTTRIREKCWSDRV
jgi:hypothetical protein